MLNKLRNIFGSTKAVYVTGVFLFSFFLGYYLLLFSKHINTDIQQHALVSYRFINENGPATPNFLYFILVALFTGFSKFKMPYYAASAVLIASALVTKYYLNYYYTPRQPLKQTAFQQKKILFAVAMLFVFCLPGIDFFTAKNFLLGQLAPNVWHNSTVIFLMPFALLLFYKTCFLITESETTDKKNIIIILFLLVINALIKPSFLFTLLPAVFVWLLFFNKTYSYLYKVILLGVYSIGIIAVVVQYVIIYNRTNNDCFNCASSVVISPFTVWGHYSYSKIFSFISSFLFPLLFILFSKGRVLYDAVIKFGFINWLLGLIIYILFTETGERQFHGNFSWQMVTANYIFFYLLGIKLFFNIDNLLMPQRQQKFLKTTFLLHFIWGLFYFFKIILFNHYA